VPFECFSFWFRTGQIETELIQLVLPALPDGESMDLVDAETEIANEPWVGAVRSAGAESVNNPG